MIGREKIIINLLQLKLQTEKLRKTAGGFYVLKYTSNTFNVRHFYTEKSQVVFPLNILHSCMHAVFSESR